MSKLELKSKEKQNLFLMKTIQDIYTKNTVNNKTLQTWDPNVENASIIRIKLRGRDFSQLILNGWDTVCTNIFFKCPYYELHR